MKPEPIAYRRFWRTGKPVDNALQPINSASCKALSRIWVRRLAEGAFSRIEFLMSDESRVVIRAQSDAVRVDPATGEHVWGRLGRRVPVPNFGAYRLQNGTGTQYVGPSIGFRLMADPDSLFDLRRKINGAGFDADAMFPPALFDVDPPMDTLAPGDAA